MLLALLLLAVPPGLPTLPDGGTGAPSPREMAQLFFLAGDLRRAVDVGRRCIAVEGKKCEPFYKALVEYEALIPKNDKLTRAEAKAYLEWDKLISPKAEGKLTAPVRDRYVDRPLAAARQAMAAKELETAKQIIGFVLEVEPKNTDAKALLEELKH